MIILLNIHFKFNHHANSTFFIYSDMLMTYEAYQTKNHSKFLLKYHMIFVVAIIINMIVINVMPISMYLVIDFNFILF